MKSVTAFETQPAEWYKTCNIRQFNSVDLFESI